VRREHPLESTKPRRRHHDAPSLFPGRARYRVSTLMPVSVLDRMLLQQLSVPVVSISMFHVGIDTKEHGNISLGWSTCGIAMQTLRRLGYSHYKPWGDDEIIRVPTDQGDEDE
jgi:hypothetical protein